MDEKRQDNYHFLKEQIKKKPADKKSLRLHLGWSVLFGVIVGLVAALVFCAVRPVFENWFSDGNQEVRLSEEEPEEPLKDEAETDPVYITETKQMELADYQTLQNKLYGVGKEANRSVVSVVGVKKAKDWFASDYETQGQGAGIVIADANQKFLIVTERKLIADANEIEVSFYNGATEDAKLVAYDGNTGIAVLSVDKKQLDTKTKRNVQVAALGSSGGVSQGTMVIAIGSPLGEVYSILTGSVTASDNEITTADSNYDIITTDIIGTENGSGALIDLDGKVIGLIMQGYGNQDNRNTVTALGISELRDLIEKLSNGIVPTYLGLEISTVTEEIAEEYHLPSGIYIKNVQVDSPAMEAGLQTGDVIVQMDQDEVLTESQYESFLQDTKSDQEVEITVKRMGADNEYQEVVCKAVLDVLK